MPSSTQKPATIGYRHFGSCQVQTWGGYVHVYRRDDNYRGDVACFDGDRSLSDLKEMHEALGRAIAVLEVHQRTDQAQAEEAIRTRFDRCDGDD